MHVRASARVLGKTVMDVRFTDTDIFARADVTDSGLSTAVFTATEEDERNRLWGKAFLDLRAYGALASDWDGEGGLPPDPNVLSVASTLLAQWRRSSSRSLPPVRILPTSGGTILIEWQDSNRYMEAEITRSGEIEWMRIDGHEPAEHWITRAARTGRPDFGNWAHTTVNPTEFASGDEWAA